ncbi:hypothetical protein GGR53DRAFT_470452 [Hypoxylon sp. FL1150]|nr:hypothetical protein GGR53DRAFT_470452 [Hypoxylon sp. FL1150]
MKSDQVIVTFFALASAALAAPAAADSATAQSRGQAEWTGDTMHTLEARGKGWGKRCHPGRGDCKYGLGCYGCLGHHPVCQEGPSSYHCCYESDHGRRCEVMPRGENE